jgi:hypothetical protein
VVHAEEDGPGSLAIGVHGMGGEWNSGRPTFRWKSSDKLSFDFTPVITIEDGNGNNMYNDYGGTNDYEGRTYGLNVGMVRQIRNIGGLSLGWRAEIGYVYGSFGSIYAYSSPFPGSSSSHQRRRSIDLGFGPDLEYFPAAVPGLSIGASAQIHYQYMSDHYQSAAIYTESFLSPTSSEYGVRQTRLNLLGELLTIRYYY